MLAVFFALWFFIPAAAANMAPLFAAKLPVLKRWSFPLDGYHAWKGQRVFGDHKTVRGLLSGIVVGILVTKLQFSIAAGNPHLAAVLPSAYRTLHPEVLGFLLSFGALAGDSLKSFFKRQWQVESGKSFFPFDQVDFIFGGLIASALLIHLSLLQYILIIVIYTMLHICATVVGYLIKLKKDPI